MTVAAVAGLGRVGLPVAVESGKPGFDIGVECRAVTDPSREMADAEMRSAARADYPSDAAGSSRAGVVVKALR